MDILSVVFCGKFNAGEDFQRRSPGGPECLVQTGYGVVICQGYGREPLFSAYATSSDGLKVPSEQVE